MFKKCVPSGSHTQLSKSDAKKLRKAAAETMGVDETLLESSGLMPPKSDVVVGNPNNAKVYCVNDQPLFFDPNGKVGGSCDTLWAIPGAMPAASYWRVSEGPGRRGPDVARSSRRTRVRWRGDDPVGGDALAAGDVLALRAAATPTRSPSAMAVSKARPRRAA